MFNVSSSFSSFPVSKSATYVPLTSASEARAWPPSIHAHINNRTSTNAAIRYPLAAIAITCSFVALYRHTTSPECSKPIDGMVNEVRPFTLVDPVPARWVPRLQIDEQALRQAHRGGFPLLATLLRGKARIICTCFHGAGKRRSSTVMQTIRGIFPTVR